MPVTGSGIYEVVLEQTYQNQEIFNVFHYLNTLGLDDEQEKCADAFDETLMATLAGLQSTNLDYNLIRVANLTGNLADFSKVPSQGDGDVVGSDIVSFTAFSFRYNRETKDTRNGAKRFAGLIEENVQSTGFGPTFFSSLQAFAILLGNDISTVGGIFSPIILRKPPAAGPLYTYNTVSSVTALNRTTTQSSRKVF